MLARTVGIGGAGWFVGLASGLALNLALARALWRDPSAGLGWASWVTLTRATLAVGVAALTAASFELPVATATLVTLASVALALDFVDGWLARRTGTESALGAKLDGEVDAFLILVLSIEVAPTAGGWVLLIGLARYAFLAAGWALPWLRAPLPRRDWRKTVTASQGVALVIAASGVPPLWVSRVLLAVALAHARRVVRPRRLVAVAAPGRSARSPGCGPRPASGSDRRRSRCSPWRSCGPRSCSRSGRGCSPRLLRRGSRSKGSSSSCLAVALPTRARRLVPWLVGPLLGVLVLDQALRPRLLHRVRPARSTRSRIGAISRSASATVRDTFGSRDADLAVAAAAVLGLAALVVPALAVGQLTRVAARHRRRSLPAVGVLTAVWALCWVFGAQVSGAGIASTSAAASRRQRGAAPCRPTSAPRLASGP